MEPKSLFAAIDLGSNSFRLEIGRLEAGHLRRVEYIKETVHQGSGLDAERNLTDEAIERGLACLARFAERIAGFRPAHVRAVATQTLREARNRDAFLAQARKILGFPIEVIAGREEARLIYLGVSHLLPDSDERRLVVDIGGRSTELILGQGHVATTLESYRVGSVAWSIKHFPGALWTLEAFRSAEIAAKAVLDETISLYPRSSWDRAYGSSGTIGAVADALEAAIGRAAIDEHQFVRRITLRQHRRDAGIQPGQAVQRAGDDGKARRIGQHGRGRRFCGDLACYRLGRLHCSPTAPAGIRYSASSWPAACAGSALRAGLP